MDIFLKREKFIWNMKKRIRNSTKIMENDLKSEIIEKIWNLKERNKKNRIKKKQLNNYSILKTPDP